MNDSQVRPPPGPEHYRTRFWLQVLTGAVVSIWLFYGCAIQRLAQRVERLEQRQ